MGHRFFSTKDRPFHLGPYPLERLARVDAVDLSAVPAMQPLSFRDRVTPHSIVAAMGEYQAMMDAIAEGVTHGVRSEVPEDVDERARHLKSFGYFQDASQVGICALSDDLRLDVPLRNPDIDRLAGDLKTRQTKTLASGIDMIMAKLKESMEAEPGSIDAHTHALALVFENTRAPRDDEPGAEWIAGANPYRGCLRATEAAVILANYLGVLGYSAKAHSATTTDVELNRLAVASGLAVVEGAFG